MKDKKFFIIYTNFKYLISIFLVLLNLINISFCSECTRGDSITDTKKCFNDVLTFNNLKYRAGHFVTYKNGDMIVEFSDDGGDDDGFSRIFYGLKKDGRYYFPNNSPTWEIKYIGKIDAARGRYESLNLLVVTENDLDRNNEFLFSTSSYDSLTELHIIENGTYIYDKTENFFGKKIFSFQYSMVEVKHMDKIFYFAGFTCGSGDLGGDRIRIKKFGFKSFSLIDYNNYNNKIITIDYNHNNRIINLFALNNLEILVLTYIKNDNNLYFKFYNYDLVEKGSEIYIETLTITDGDGLFFKSVELPENRRVIAFFKHGQGDGIYLRIYQFFKNGENPYTNSPSLNIKTSFNYWYSSKVTFSDIYKIRDDRLALATVTTETSNYNELVLILYDLYNDYKNAKLRYYIYNIEKIKITKELSLYSFNNYLMLSITGGYYFADLLIFGYANGTDSVINISPYLLDSYDYVDDSPLNLFSQLYSNISIDNNVFFFV